MVQQGRKKIKRETLTMSQKMENLLTRNILTSKSR